MHRTLTRGFVALAAIASAMALAQAPHHGIDASIVDKSVDPGTDFFTYANGGWLKQAVIPSDQTSTGTFNELSDRNLQTLKSVMETAKPDRTPAGKAVRFYRLAMDVDRANRLGAKPIEPILARIETIKDADGIVREMGHLDQQGIGIAFGFGIGQDPRQSTVQIANLRQGGLGLPTREDYLDDNARSATLRNRYQEHIVRTMALLGDAPAVADSEAKSVMSIETALAKASKSRVELRDPQANYHKMSVEELQRTAPGGEWPLFFRSAGLPKPGPINVGQPEFFAAYAKLLHDAPVSDWRAYLRWRTISGLSSYLSQPFVEEDFRYASLLSGQKEMTPRWKRALASTQGALGEAVGQLYVDRTFSPEAKKRAYDMVVNLKAVLRDRIQQLDWMGPETKKEATLKLDRMRIKVGYPDKWQEYAKLAVKDDSYVQNVLRSREYESKKNLAELGKPVDRDRWGMTPPTVNAYYNPALNEIVFPAGILQPPFFDAQADDASNYGGIGAVIGHEMTHGFDDQGRQYDADGNLRDWWTAEDARRFKERTDALAEQYSQYRVAEDAPVNGRLTLGENIADLGGLTIAHLAFERATADKPQTPIDGFTPEQRFFLAWGQVWRQKMSPESLALRVRTDSHSPNEWRVRGTLANVPGFREAFGLPAPTTPPIRIW